MFYLFANKKISAFYQYNLFKSAYKYWYVFFIY